MSVLTIFYKSALNIERVKELFRERASKYRSVPGLVQKFYVHDPTTDEVGGIYMFDTLEHMEAFRKSDLAKSIRETYRSLEPPTIRSLDVVQALRDEGMPSIER
jgi:heme-degrading monooxygenase HmoA